MSNSFISLPNDYPTYQIVLASLGTIYAALFVTTSNHFVFKPKIQTLFKHSSINSTILYQILIDILTNLSTLTFILSSLFFFNNDNSLSVMIYTDVWWSGLMLGIVAFKAIAFKQQPNLKLMLLKNVIFLGLIYAVISLHYAIDIFLISIGIAMILFYIFNLLANGYQDKFVVGMEALFGYKPADQAEQEYNHSSNMPSPQNLHQLFPVSKEDIEEHIRNKFPKIKNIHLKTKRLMVQNLLKISLAVHLSKQKMENKAKRDIKYYYGTFNGTVAEKSKKIILKKSNSRDQPGSSEELSPDSPQQDFQGHNSAIFYIFPVRLFENSKALSVLFSVSINLGLGFLLSVVLKMSQTLRYGQYFQLLFSLLLLPVIPSVSKEQFMHNMTLTSLWKYCLYGIFICIVCLFSDNVPFFSFTSNKQLIFAPVIQLIALSLSTFFVFRVNPTPYSFCFIWGAAIILISTMIFKHC